MQREKKGLIQALAEYGDHCAQIVDGGELFTQTSLLLDCALPQHAPGPELGDRLFGALFGETVFREHEEAIVKACETPAHRRQIFEALLEVAQQNLSKVTVCQSVLRILERLENMPEEKLDTTQSKR